MAKSVHSKRRKKNKSIQRKVIWEGNNIYMYNYIFIFKIINQHKERKFKMRFVTDYTKELMEQGMILILKQRKMHLDFQKILNLFFLNIQILYI